MHSSGTRTGLSSKPHCSPTSQIQPLRILVPGCGTSHLSEHLYDVGFKAITNIDLSEIAISDMLCRNACQRPGMKWQVMDITTMQVYVITSIDSECKRRTSHYKRLVTQLIKNNRLC